MRLHIGFRLRYPPDAGHVLSHVFLNTSYPNRMTRWRQPAGRRIVIGHWCARVPSGKRLRTGLRNDRPTDQTGGDLVGQPRSHARVGNQEDPPMCRALARHTEPTPAHGRCRSPVFSSQTTPSRHDSRRLPGRLSRRRDRSDSSRCQTKAYVQDRTP